MQRGCATDRTKAADHDIEIRHNASK
jgi:hypothetical protein